MKRTANPATSSNGRRLSLAALAFFIGLAGLLLPNGDAGAAGDGAKFYFPLDDLTVQYEHKTCKRLTLALALQIEYTQGDKASHINSYVPKLKSVVFAALDDHLAKEKKAKRGRIQRVAKKAVQSVLGKKLVSDVLITRLMQMK